MITKEQFESYLSAEYTFNLRRLASAIAIEKGVVLNSDRIKVELWEEAFSYQIRALLDVATKEEQVFDFPDNWLVRLGRWWHRVKTTKIPRKIRKWFPAREYRVWAIHKFPELGIPVDIPLREFVSFRVLSPEALERLQRQSETLGTLSEGQSS